MRIIDTVTRDGVEAPLTTSVKYNDDSGAEQVQKVPYSHVVCESLQDAVAHSTENLLTKEESESEQAQVHAAAKVLEYFNSTLKTNASQNARASFLLTVGENRQKTIERTAKAISVLQGISVADARNLIVAAGQ